MKVHKSIKAKYEAYRIVTSYVYCEFSFANVLISHVVRLNVLDQT